jgi:polyphenol oxidase
MMVSDQRGTLTPRTASNLSGLPGIAHGFFGRTGGVSKGLYGNLNCGLGSADARAHVFENRRRVAAHLDTSGEHLLTCFQIHSADAVVIDRPWSRDGQPRADALVTRTPGLALGALAADCTPILFADAKAGVIAAAHAGWKGALGGIVEATLAAMEQLGGRRADIHAAIGPCIGPKAYEVGPEFAAVFTGANPGNGVYFQPDGAAGREHFDLPRFVADTLRAAGVGTVELAWACTYMDEANYFSYRRATHRRETDYGRQISAIVITGA